MKDKQAKYPQLRFKGFTDPWEKRTLGQTTTKAKSYSLSRDVERDHETGYRYIHYGDIHTGVADIVTEHTKLPNIEPANYDELRVNDLVVADASEDYQGIAEPAVVVGLPTHLVAGLHTITLRPSSASSLYLYYLLHTDSFKHFGYQMGTGLKVFGISWSNLSKFTFMIPSRPEQEMIVKLIESVDNLIAVNQRKLDLLKEQKKGYLQKMFPKNGTKVPELRFAGFADAWVQRNLGEWSDVRDGTHASPKYIEQGHPMVTSKNLTDSGLDMSDVSYLTDEDFNEINQRSKVDIGDILFGMIGTIGKPVIVDRDDFAIKNVALIKEKTSPEIINTWLIQYLKSPSFERFIQKENAGGTQKFIALGLIRDMKLMTPSVQEQARIGELLNHLDNLIAANQRKLDLLKEQKKGFLQNMFV
jgi:type I restriction enzyme S subunit|nr:MAG TPA: hypothetical protein [Caudoviricetes sp.]